MKTMKHFIFLLSIIALVGFTSCNNDDDAPLDATNVWIYDVMKEIYYWTDDLPANVNHAQTPEDFFDALLYSGDRFSIIVPDYQELINSLSGVSQDAGYEFALSQVTGTEDVVAIILYIKEGSPAADVDLKRGDVISKINGTAMTLSNYKTVVPQIYSNHSLTYSRYNEATTTYDNKGTIDLAAVVLSENPSLLDTVYTFGSQKIGYYVYNFFSPGANNTSTYNDEMDQVIANFKNSGVNALILDLRYNSGGAVSSARNLASLVGTEVSSSQIFYEYQWNELYMNYFNSLADGDAQLRAKFLDKPENIGSQINGQIYILTGSRTASASELIINGLDPYMNVTIIGKKTVGKNVGSVPIEDTKNNENKYGLLPIVFKIMNSQGYSEYDQGFTPLGDNLVDDFQEPMKALGDIQEPLLARAIQLITGDTGGRIESTTGHVFDPIMTTIDSKTRSNRLIIDDLPK